MARDFLEHILNVSRRMSETRALTPLLNYVMDEAINLVGAERGYVVLIQPDGTFDLRAKRDRKGRDLDDAQDQVSRSVLDRVINSAQPLVIRDAMGDSRFDNASSIVLLGLRSIMCVPLIVRGDVIGAIYVENRSIKGRFSEDDLPSLILFGNQAAVAIENARLNDKLEARVAERTHELEQAMFQVEKGWSEAIEANRLRTVWLNKVVHDIRAPLTIVLGSLSILQEGTLGEINADQLEWIEKSMGTIDHISRLTDDLFDISRLEAGGITLALKTVVLDEFIRDINDVAHGLPWPESVTLDLKLVPPLPQIAFDPLRIRQVLLNLYSNALKFTATGTVTLQVRSLSHRNEVLFVVADTGEGIVPDKIVHLFKRFQQVDDNEKRRQKGSGLGLAICRELVEMHGGRIWVESNPGVGSSFMFTLPIGDETV